MKPGEAVAAAAKGQAMTEKARRVYGDLSPDGQRLLDRLTKQVAGQDKIKVRRIAPKSTDERLVQLAQRMVDERLPVRTRNGKTLLVPPTRPTYYSQRNALVVATKQATDTEAIHGLLREALEYLAERDRQADERDRIADSREAAMLKLTRWALGVGVTGVMVGAAGVVVAVVALG